MATRKTVDQILDGAADILENDGWVTESCYDSELGGYCTLGAIAKAVYPKVKGADIARYSFPLQARQEIENYGESDAYYHAKPDPRHIEAVEFLGKRLGAKNMVTEEPVYSFNDGLPSGVLWNLNGPVVDEKVRYKSSRRVVTRLRNAAKAYRKQQEKA